MKQLGIVFRFEYFGYVKRKSFIGLTLALMLLAAVALTWPRGAALLEQLRGGEGEAALKTVAVSGAGAWDEEQLAALDAAGEEQGYAFVLVESTEEELEAAVEAGDYDSAVLLTGPLSYKRVVVNLQMTDSFDNFFPELLRGFHQGSVLAAAGMPPAEIESLLHEEVESEVVMVAQGKDQMQNFFYTYALIFLLYFAIILYGQFVASSVATEKSTRAMELLITSTNTNSLMFGKVFGAGFAGLSQLALLLGTCYLFYNINIEYYVDNPIVQSLFAMPLSILIYTLVFFILGFFIYAFIYAALASLVSRMEDLSTAIAPVTFLFVIAFFVVIFSMTSGSVDNPLMVFCSYFPLTSPMAMFVRIAMGSVAFWKVALSIAILVASTVGMGVFSAMLYRLGVLLYGNPPKPGEIIRMLRAQKKGAAR